MSDGYITRDEHNEFARRIDDENRRQNKRLDELEVLVKKLGDLPITVIQIKDNQLKQEKLLEELCRKPVVRVNSFKQSFLDAIAKAFGTGAIAAIIYLIMSINK